MDQDFIASLNKIYKQTGISCYEPAVLDDQTKICCSDCQESILLSEIELGRCKDCRRGYNYTDHIWSDYWY